MEGEGDEWKVPLPDATGIFCVDWVSENLGVIRGGGGVGDEWKVPLPDATGASCVVPK